MSDRPSQDGKLTPGAPRDPVPFGKYWLLGLIARGGMAEVYRARAKADPRRLLAVKVMRPQLAREARFVDMFHREGKLAMMLRNRCIVETKDVGQHDGRHYIAMEYIGGRDLTQVLRRCQETGQRIPVPHAVYIAARIAEGLHFAHTLTDEAGRSLNIVNRDVSPSNVRLSFDGGVKLLDFGIAQALMKFTSEIGILKGKFSYMSPEQIRGMPLDARTDVFSAGIILHEMLTTEKLFRGDTEFALMERVRKAEVPPPSQFNRRVTPDLDAISLKALARDLPDRYQTAAELAADLDALIDSYRFEPSELRQFVRQLFRKEYTKDLEESAAALAIQPGDRGTRGRALSNAVTPTHPATLPGGTPTDTMPRGLAPGTDAPTDPDPRRPDDRPRGFWATLFKKRK
ncbi:MAG TPA: serine/threonine-protein kinase [Kofleriaceae bacterium]|nr:serine/threonine-protein kinase [Kofleriaceae bacterium]